MAVCLVADSITKNFVSVASHGADMPQTYWIRVWIIGRNRINDYLRSKREKTSKRKEEI